jgi:hypothetical protein
LSAPEAGYGTSDTRDGTETDMTTPGDSPDLDDVIDPQENPTRDRTQHAKDPHPADEVLEHRTEQERQAVGSDDANPAGADEHSATD